MPAALKQRRAKGGANGSAGAEAPVRTKPATGRAKVRNASPMAAGDFAKQQIARLEPIIEGLIEKVNDGELAAIDRLLKILDRLDRYYGYSPTAKPEESGDDARERILRKLSDVDARRAAAADDIAFDERSDEARGA
jgi:hypothetical protein